MTNHLPGYVPRTVIQPGYNWYAKPEPPTPTRVVKVVPTEKIMESLKQCSMSIEEIEKLTGLEPRAARGWVRRQLAKRNLFLLNPTGSKYLYATDRVMAIIK